MGRPRFLDNRDDFGAGPVRDFAGYGERPPEFRWPGDARVAVLLIANYEEGSEYSLPMGDGRNDMLGERAHSLPGEIRDLCVESVYDCDAYNDELPYYVEVLGRQHLVLPGGLDVNDVRFIMPAGYASGRDFLDDACAAFDRLSHDAERTGCARMLSIGVHPRLLGRPARAEALARFIDHAQRAGGAWFARRDEVARFWLERFPPPGG